MNEEFEQEFLDEMRFEGMIEEIYQAMLDEARIDEIAFCDEITLREGDDGGD